MPVGICLVALLVARVLSAQQGCDFCKGSAESQTHLIQSYIASDVLMDMKGDIALGTSQ